MLWDTDLGGFGLLALPSGSKSYVYQYRIGGPAGRLRRYTVGRHGESTSDRARKHAEELAAQVRQGIDPIDAKRDAMATKERANSKAAEQERLARELAFSAYWER